MNKEAINLIEKQKKKDEILYENVEKNTRKRKIVKEFKKSIEAEIQVLDYILEVLREQKKEA